MPGRQRTGSGEMTRINTRSMDGVLTIVMGTAGFHKRRPRAADRWGAKQGEYVGLRLVRDDPERATSVTPETWGQIKKRGRTKEFENTHAVD